MDSFDDRVARLEEHCMPLSAKDWLDRAENGLAHGDEFGRTIARHALAFARIAHDREERESDD